MKKILYVLFFMTLMVAASALEPNQTTLDQLTAGLFYNSASNNTQYFDVDGNNIVWVPWFDSSTACQESNLKTYSTVISPNITHNVQVSDEFSESCLVAAQAGNETLMDGFFNTMQNLQSQGSLPCWVGYSNITVGDVRSIGCLSTDTASDGSARLQQCMVQASKNTAYSESARNKYEELAINMSQDHIALETNTVNWDSSVTGVSGSVLPFGGYNCAQSNLSCSTSIWTGYFPDLTKSMISAYALTENQTYMDYALDYANAYVTLSLQNDSDGDGFGVAPFNFNYQINGSGHLQHTDGGGVNSYHYAEGNPQWDDSDAPRALQMCDTLRAFNASGQNLGVEPLLSLVNYCTAWGESNTYTDDTSCIQYFYNGTCATSIRGGYYENGLGYYTHTWINLTGVDKVNESINHFNTGTQTYDSTACMGVYRGVRPAKALITYMSLDLAAYQKAVTPPTPSSCSTESTLITEFSDNLGGGFSSMAFVLAIVGAATIILFGMRDGNSFGESVEEGSTYLLVIGGAFIMVTMTVIIMERFAVILC